MAGLDQPTYFLSRWSAAARARRPSPDSARRPTTLTGEQESRPRGARVPQPPERPAAPPPHRPARPIARRVTSGPSMSGLPALSGQPGWRRGWSSTTFADAFRTGRTPCEAGSSSSLRPSSSRSGSASGSASGWALQVLAPRRSGHGGESGNPACLPSGRLPAVAGQHPRRGGHSSVVHRHDAVDVHLHGSVRGGAADDVGQPGKLECILWSLDEREPTAGCTRRCNELVRLDGCLDECARRELERRWRLERLDGARAHDGPPGANDDACDFASRYLTPHDFGPFRQLRMPRGAAGAASIPAKPR
jgi:hypothetical protein